MLGFFLDSKMQCACFVIICIFVYTSIKEGYFLNKRYGKKTCNIYSDIMLGTSLIAILFDGLTASMVNRLDSVPLILNQIAHFCFFISLQFFFFVFFLYILSITDTIPETKMHRFFHFVPQIIATIITIVFIKNVNFVIGKHQNYSVGISATTTFVMIFLYCSLALGHIFRKIDYFERRKKISFILWFAICICLFIIQSVYRETLLSALGVTLIVLVAYEWQENPLIHQLEFFNSEMVTSFATLIESKDGSTGGHIKRTSLYVEIIANNLKRKKEYSDILTKDFLINLKKAAPMHDLGKIGIPDYILQKPGRFTPEEFEIMKQHSTLGGEMIKKTFGHLGDEDYEKMAFDVATYHHEKFNGYGYPTGLVGKQIPLSARIMAVADVFDAISAKRCYRDAMPLEECFKIIKEGRGSDFDPDIVDSFFEEEDEIRRIVKEVSITN